MENWIDAVVFWVVMFAVVAAALVFVDVVEMSDLKNTTDLSAEIKGYL
jgi:hypothetical protein